MKIFSIVGTDTEIGKTYSTTQILEFLNHNNSKAFALKPISAGLDEINGKLINEDVFRILSANHAPISEDVISPLQFQLAIAPHIAAKYQDTQLTAQIVIEKIQNSIDIIQKQVVASYSMVNHCQNYNTVSNSHNSVDYLLIEGVGGIMVPLNNTETYIDVLQALEHSVILVVGMKLGCLNHALLTYHALITNNIKVVGWIANCIIKDMPYFNENLEYLKQALDSPLLAIIPHKDKIQINNNFKKIFKIIL